MTMCFIGNVGEKTWRIVAIRQIRQSFLPAKVLFYTVYEGQFEQLYEGRFNAHYNAIKEVMY